MQVLDLYSFLKGAYTLWLKLLFLMYFNILWLQDIDINFNHIMLFHLKTYFYEIFLWTNISSVNLMEV